jgi:hypothetical protein
MLEFNKDDLDLYIENLNKRGKRFTVERKRGERHLILKGKKIAKLKRRNSISQLDKDESKQILSLFGSVKKSVNRKLEKDNFQITPIDKKYNSVFTNKNLFLSVPVGTQFYYVDVKHCYWRIAYLQGYITEYYYKKVLEKPDLKLYRNMALSCIIAPKQVEYYSEGQKQMTIKEDSYLYETVYQNIRHYAWNLFGRLCFEKIGEENCMGYFTDGILVFDKDLKTVKTMLARHKLQHRIILCEKTATNEYVYVDEGEVRKF